MLPRWILPFWLWTNATDMSKWWPVSKWSWLPSWLLLSTSSLCRSHLPTSICCFMLVSNKPKQQPILKSIFHSYIFSTVCVDDSDCWPGTCCLNGACGSKMKMNCPCENTEQCTNSHNAMVCAANLKHDNSSAAVCAYEFSLPFYAVKLPWKILWFCCMTHM